MSNDEIRDEFNTLYDKVNTRVREYIVENLSPEIPRLINEYNEKRLRIDTCREMRTDIGRYFMNVPTPSRCGNVSSVEWLFGYYENTKNNAKDGMFTDNIIKPKYLPFFIGMGQYYKKIILWGVNPWSKFCIWVRRVLGLSNKLDTALLSRALKVLVHSSDYDFYLNELKASCKDARAILLDRLGKFGVIPANSATDPDKFIAYGDIVDELPTLPQDLKAELKPSIDKLAELKEQMEEK